MGEGSKKTSLELTILTTGRPPSMMAKGPKTAFLLMIHGEHLGKRFEVGEVPLTIGRSAACTIQLSEYSVSRQHCKILRESGSVFLFDENSTNGTYVNTSVVNKQELVDGDRIFVGRNVFKFYSGDQIEQAYHEATYRMMTTDGLTGAHNRDFFEEELLREFKRFRRYHRSLSLMMLDVDKFKLVNDTAGHVAGDRLLASVASCIASVLRSNDLFCRVGGDEFAVLMPEVELCAALDLADRLQTTIQEENPGADDLDFPITLSIGVAEATLDTHSAEDLKKAADDQMYEAKNAGRDCVRPSPSR